MILYKLTNENDKTYNDTQWGENITHKASGEGEICGPGFIHAYETPYHASLFNLIHGRFNPDNMHLWKCEGNIVKNDGLKIGCTKLTTIKRIKIPDVTMKQRIYFGYLCVKDILWVFEEKYPDDERPQHALELVNHSLKYLDENALNKKYINFINIIDKLSSIDTNTKEADHTAANYVIRAIITCIRSFIKYYNIKYIAYTVMFVNEAIKLIGNIDMKKMINEKIKLMIEFSQ